MIERLCVESEVACDLIFRAATEIGALRTEMQMLSESFFADGQEKPGQVLFSKAAQFERIEDTLTQVAGMRIIT